MDEERGPRATAAIRQRAPVTAAAPTDLPADPPPPRTARGERTRRRLLDAAAREFGEKGFHEGSISGITARAGVALGSFYTYFATKAGIFRALVSDMSARVRDHVAPAIAQGDDAIDRERRALEAFLAFARDHDELYRIVDEAEFVDPESFRRHYDATAARIAERLRRGGDEGTLRHDLGEVEAWAYMGMNVFLGLRYGRWERDADVGEIAARANRLLAEGIARRR